jgi:hypothetical protein
VGQVDRLPDRVLTNFAFFRHHGLGCIEISEQIHHEQKTAVDVPDQKTFYLSERTSPKRLLVVRRLKIFVLTAVEHEQ